MKSILINLFYEGKTIKEAIAFCERCYGERPSQKEIEAAKKAAKQAGKVWE